MEVNPDWGHFQPETSGYGLSYGPGYLIGSGSGGQIGQGGGGGINMASSSNSGGVTMIDTSGGGVGPLVATVSPSGQVIIGHENSVPVYSTVAPTTANSLQQSNLLPILVIGVVAFLLFKK